MKTIQILNTLFLISKLILFAAYLHLFPQFLLESVLHVHSNHIVYNPLRQFLLRLRQLLQTLLVLLHLQCIQCILPLLLKIKYLLKDKVGLGKFPDNSPTGTFSDSIGPTNRINIMTLFSTNTKLKL